MLLNNIDKIQNKLHAEALNVGFYSKSEQELNESANAFVEGFCLRNKLACHPISPLRWSFESAEYGMYDEGVIELHNIDNNQTAFESVDVSEAKVTDPE
tara:strand:- start:61 stop:357 length:297 start_codon:yes stop_codon:yes gene_type:complete